MTKASTRPFPIAATAALQSSGLRTQYSLTATPRPAAARVVSATAVWDDGLPASARIAKDAAFGIESHRISKRLALSPGGTSRRPVTFAGRSAPSRVPVTIRIGTVELAWLAANAAG